ncbi:MAG: CDC27 family protein [Treponema sp.]|jgi:thioredoxin-like negative regulator of GroEL|nr:CDC27 family protein [Treponema sp.]
MFSRVFLAGLLFSLFSVYAQTNITPGEIPGDSAVADKYTEWALKAIGEGRWNEALNALERGRDYGSVSSDISYLLALARNHFNQPLGAVVQVLDEALGAARWRLCSAADARYLKAEILIKTKRYNEALGLIALLPENHRTASLKLRCLRFLPSNDEFRSFASDTFERYPRESEPVSIFLNFLKYEYDAGFLPQKNDMELLESVFKRLPVLLPIDPELAWMAAPFMRDAAEARRVIAAYRAVNKAVPFSLPAALNLGVIDEETAIEELFGLIPPDEKPSFLDKKLLEEIYALMRDEPRRELFRRNLSLWSGLIKEDANGDGFYEASALYRQGMLVSCGFDLNQDGIPELTLEFEAGEPKTAALYALPEAGGQRPPYPPRETGRHKIFITWEQFPSVLEARLGNEYFFLWPMYLNYAPVRFEQLAGTGLLFPELVPEGISLSRRSLVAHSIKVERPSREFPGALETIEVNQGIPVRAREHLEGRLVSETDFLRGRPIAQRVDLDLDGRLETVRHFRRIAPVFGGTLSPVESLLDYIYDFDYADSDWDGDGIYERRHYN